MQPRDLPSGFHQLLYYRVSMRFVSLCQLYVCPQNHLSSFTVADRHSVNFCASAGQVVYFQCVRRAFRQLPSALCVAMGPIFRASAGPFANYPSINFSNVRGRSVNFRQLSMRPHHLPSTGVNFSCISGTFSQLSVRPWYLP